MWDNISVLKFAYSLVPTFLRKPVLSAFVKAVTNPLSAIYYDWYNKRQEHLYILDHNWQVCYMRGALNDKFDQDQRRIYIDGTGGDANKTYIYTPGENQTKYLGTIFIYNSLEFADTGADFIVHVPAEIMANQFYEVHAQIQLYKLGGKRYLIIEI
ncbi:MULTISPECIES: hypothetical protein [Bizionia]|uniref:Uncharacterized protein n=1 Tax=Bizionia algoritergicola TaxID=291187 RepID=A0A5D0R0I8_9FLAO|nr:MULTISPECIES: hypothetical protein [Bizionia]OBX20951.1 hypothetical protein BAA08_14525 [Bizionia sp. APA-3]TYB74599.1 hypothetical protein ES675_00195 [Bizionia algoritergicola]